MTEEFKKAFSNLSVDEKRNQINNELIIISELIKLKEKSLNLPSVLSVKEYISNRNISESEMLDFLYEDIYNIQKELITIFSVNEQKWLILMWAIFVMWLLKGTSKTICYVGANNEVRRPLEANMWCQPVVPLIGISEKPLVKLVAFY